MTGRTGGTEKRSNREQIGNIILDYTHYPGEDYYCDGAIEDELLEIVRNYPPTEFQRMIEERAEWPVLYHLSHLRENIVDWLPMKPGCKVLEIGSGCGAITGKLAEKAGSVTGVDLSRKRCLINACRHQECSNVTLHVGNFEDVEPDLPEDFDYIFFIGVFEYGESYIHTEQPYTDWLKMMRRHLAPDGKIIIAIENRLGLKYFAGCAEDHLGSYFSGIMDYPEGGGVKTFVRSRLEEIFRESGWDNYHFYYPYPDYKFMHTLYSDQRLPMQGELSDNLRNFDRDRMLLMDEKAVFDGLIRDGLFPVFSNSYLVVLGDAPETIYARYSNDRAEEYRIRTEICCNTEGKRIVRKYPLGKKAADHVSGIVSSGEQLSAKFQGSGLEMNRCCYRKEAGCAELEYVDGVTLEELLDRCLKQKDEEGFFALFEEYVKRISFGETQEEEQEQPITDYDLIFANILIPWDKSRQKLGQGAERMDLYEREEILRCPWVVIDYEWTVPRQIPAAELAYRSIYCYQLADPGRKVVDMERIQRMLGISDPEAEQIRAREMLFQKQITGQRKALGEVREAIGHRLLDPVSGKCMTGSREEKKRVQIYEDRGMGYREEESYFIPDGFCEEELVDLKLKVSGEVRALRIDPAMGSCLVRIRKLLWNGQPLSTGRRVLVTNGRKVGKHCFVFFGSDPNLNLRIARLSCQQENTLEAELEVVLLPEGLAGELAGIGKE